MLTRILLILATAVAMSDAARCQPSIAEEDFNFPITAADATGKVDLYQMHAVVWRDKAATGARPLLVFGHGYVGPGGAQWLLNRSARANAEWFASRGFVVVMPSRLGYGKTGGPNVEIGSCYGVSYKAGLDGAASQIRQAIEWAAKMPDVDIKRTVYVGQSLGGATGIALASLNLQDLRAIVNFSGGHGGEPGKRQPCNAEELSNLFAAYGRVAKTSTLWLYADNDSYWGDSWPKQWATAFKAGGAPAEFMMFSPGSGEGHSLYRNNPELWRPVVLEFLQKQGAYQPP